MQTTLDIPNDSITLELSGLPEAKTFFAETKKQTGFFLELDQELRQFQRFQVTATAPAFNHRFEAEVVQVIPTPNGYGTGFQLCDWTTAKALELDRKLRGPQKGEDHESVVSPAFRIKNMNPNERFVLATKASRAERQILLRDQSPQVLLGLLAHPRLEDKEVKAIVESTASTAAIMKRVASNRKWMSNSEIQLAVVRSPKTPPPLAIKHLPFLRTPDLQVIAKGAAGRDNVRRAALRVYLERTGKR